MKQVDGGEKGKEKKWERGGRIVEKIRGRRGREEGREEETSG